MLKKGIHPTTSPTPFWGNKQMRYGIKAGGAILCLLTLLVLSSRAADGEIKQAVNRGVQYLKGIQREDGTWAYVSQDRQFRLRDPHDEVGATALAGMTLLECGVPGGDPVVEKAAAAVRQASIGLTHTYSLSLGIMFLDR